MNNKAGRIAGLLQEGCKYRQIQNMLNVSPSRIAKVKKRLKQGLMVENQYQNGSIDSIATYPEPYNGSILVASGNNNSSLSEGSVVSSSINDLKQFRNQSDSWQETKDELNDLQLRIDIQLGDIRNIWEQQEKLRKELNKLKSESAEREKFLAAEIERMKSIIIEKPKRLLIIRLKELLTCLRQEHLSLDDIQRLTNETKLLQQEFQVTCEMESKSFEASSTFTTLQNIKKWLDQKYTKFYIEKPSHQKLFDNTDLDHIQTFFNEQECRKLLGIK